MKTFVLLLFILPFYCSSQQNPTFLNEVNTITAKYDTIWDALKKTIVFTGSSSIRMWRDIETFFPSHQILNTGFGGSQTIDLLGYSKELILNYNPAKVFIYEGDNDISAHKKPKEIIHTYQSLIDQIKVADSSTKIVLISPKPSIARWDLRRKYKKLNRRLEKFSKKQANIEFANVWDIMLEKGKLKTNLFINDGLHMNSKGYDLWYQVLKNYID